MSLLLLFQTYPTGPVDGSLAVIEVDDSLATSASLSLNGSLTAVETDDASTAIGALTIAASAFITEADDSPASAATLALGGTLIIAEGGDMPSATSTTDIVGSVAVLEVDDAVSATGAVGINATLAVTEENDTLLASALVPVWYPRRGGDESWAQYEQRQLEWERQLRRIIDRSWQIANGEIDPVTFESIPPPDHSRVIGELIHQALTLDQARVAGFVAEQEQLREEEAISLLLLAA